MSFGQRLRGAFSPERRILDKLEKDKQPATEADRLRTRLSVLRAKLGQLDASGQLNAHAEIADLEEKLNGLDG